MANEKRRARGKDGRFLADNPETKDVNEAWAQPKNASVSITAPTAAKGASSKKLHKIAEPEKTLMGWQGCFALFVILLIMSLIGLA
jgi:hypothetical protein